MTRLFFVLAALLFAVMLVMFITGFSSNAPVALIVGALLAGPGFVFCLGFAIGRATNEFSIVRKDPEYRGANNRQRVTRTREPMS